MIVVPACPGWPIFSQCPGRVSMTYSPALLVAQTVSQIVRQVLSERPLIVTQAFVPGGICTGTNCTDQVEQFFIALASHQRCTVL